MTEETTLTEVGARHTATEYAAIQQIMQLLADLHGQVDDWNAILNPAVQEAQPVMESARDLTDTTLRAVTEARLDASGNLAGTILVEGLSGNRNRYTRPALESGVQVFTGLPIYADHPSQSEAQDRPERSIRDLVGRVGEAYVDDMPDGRAALRFRNGRLSETAAWLSTLIREDIAGDMSINANGRGIERDGEFVVEAFTGAKSVDFVTVAAAGGRGQLVESLTGTESPVTEVTTMADKPLSEAERKLLTEAQKRVQELEREKRQAEATRIVDAALVASQLPEAGRATVRRLVESTVVAFVEQLKVPTIKLPPDVAGLPPEAQNLWLKTYMEKLSEGEEPAAMQAWAAVYQAWEKNPDSGEWTPKQQTPEMLPGADVGPPAMSDPNPVSMWSNEALAGVVGHEIRTMRQTLAQVAGSGVAGMGSGPVAPDGAAALAESFKAFGYDEKRTATLAKGRA